MTGVPPCLRLRIHGQMGARVQEVGNEDPCTNGKGLDHFADDSYHLQLTGLAAQVDYFVFADQLDIAALVGDQAVGGKVLNFAETTQVLDRHADLLKRCILAQPDARTQSQYILE